jgi:nicotinamidase-related amidase
MNVHALIIDPQQDFCDPVSGALYVPGAENDMRGLAALLGRYGAEWGAIHVTLDSHHFLHIAHSIWWQDREGNPPAPFTIISEDDVTSGKWRTRRSEEETYSREYVAALARNGRYPLCIWPYHCLIGTPGHSISALLFPALTQWEAMTGKTVDFVRKGENPRTEHYSALRADVVDPNDTTTGTNSVLVKSLEHADRILVAGEALSHCIANTVRDLIEITDGSVTEKLVLITDACSPVTGFEGYAEDFLREMTVKGVRTMTTAEIQSDNLKAL